jgi:hypothetical protein
MIYRGKRGSPDGLYGDKTSICLIDGKKVRGRLPMVWIHPLGQKYHEWGSMGTKCSNTALSILSHHLGEPKDREELVGLPRYKDSNFEPMKFLSPYLYWRFKRDILSRLPKEGFELTSDEIAAWVAKQDKRRRTAQEALDQIDFQAIHDNMVKNKWEWSGFNDEKQDYDLPHVPSIDEIKAVALKLLKEAEACPNEYNTNCTCGGFQMYKPCWSDIELEFDFDKTREKNFLAFIKAAGDLGAFSGD